MKKKGKKEEDVDLNVFKFAYACNKSRCLMTHAYISLSLSVMLLT